MDLPSGVDRRTVLGMTTAAGGLVLLTSCSSGSPGAASAEVAASAIPTGGTPYRVGKLSDVPVGESAAGKANGKDVIVFRAAEKTVLAYSAVCTHAGCNVAPSGAQFSCPCHGSTFKAADGTVLQGPARRPLERYAAAIDGEWITVSL